MPQISTYFVSKSWNLDDANKRRFAEHAIFNRLPEMRMWSILLILSDLKWCKHHSRSLFFIFQLLGECHCWWTSESPRAHVTKFYGRLRLIRSVLRASKFSVLKLIEIVILWVFLHHPCWLQLVLALSDCHFQFLNYFVWLRIPDEGSLPEMRIWSILLVLSDLKWCKHHSRSLF